MYDPLDKSYGLLEMNPSDNYLTDQTYACYLKNNGVLYHSPTFEKKTEASGFFELNAYIETYVNNVDIRADMYEIKLDGTAVFLISSAMRARYRESLEREKLLTPGTIYLFPFNNFTFISR